MPGGTVSRVMVAWFPDWPLVAARLAEELPADVPAAVIAQGRVAACSAEARGEGVVRGLRLREAQTRCTSLAVCPADPLRDAREFEPVLASLEERSPGVEVLRPGLCAIRVRGAARYYGSEESAAGAVLEAADSLGVEARVGVADSVFAAVQAARSTTESVALLVLPPHTSRDFLAPFPVDALEQPKLASLLKRLGIHTLGDFTQLPLADVRARFGPAGALAHAMAGGEDPKAVVPRVPPRKLDRQVDFEPGLDRIDQIAFQLRAPAGEFIAALQEAGLVCTELKVALLDDSGNRSERVWGHPRHFTANDVVDRVRWQLQPRSADPSGGHSAGGITSAIVRVELIPGRVDSITGHGQALFGEGAEEKIHHGLSRLQSMLGQEAVLVPAVSGGRVLSERRLLTPWGDPVPREAAVQVARPWPGSIPDPQPATVFASPVPVQLLDAAGESVRIDGRGTLLSPPCWFCPEAAGSTAPRRAVAEWTGPWPLRQRWWDEGRRRHAERFQIVDGDGDAWLLLLTGDRWWAEARYD